MINLYKLKGETPLEALNRLQTVYPEYKDVPLSYAGRLDPMAEGVMLVLVGDENKKREDYLGLEKEYIVEILWGIETDTYDILGLVKKIKDPVEIENKIIWHQAEKYLRTFDQAYPAYSSKPVNGEPLFSLARRGALLGKTLPTHSVTIFTLGIIKTIPISRSDLLNHVKESVALVKGDFRQAEVLDMWKEKLTESEIEYFKVTRFQIRCSSGTYMRSLAHDLGKDLKCGALAFSILRTRVGEYGSNSALKLSPGRA